MYIRIGMVARELRSFRSVLYRHEAIVRGRRTGVVVMRSQLGNFPR